MMLVAAILHWDARDRHGNRNVFLICARIFGFPLNLLCTVVYVCMLKNLLNSLRWLGAMRLLPLDHNLFFHALSGWVIFVFGYIHTLAMFIHFKLNVLPDPENYLSKNGLSVDAAGYRPPPERGANYSYADWMLTSKPRMFGLVPGWANLTGVVLMALTTLLLLTSEDCVRRGGYFNLFHYCHLSHLPFAVLLTLHAPNFSYFFPVVGVFVVLQMLDKMCCCRMKTYVATGATTYDLF
jgi:hypothetical protein